MRTAAPSEGQNPFTGVHRSARRRRIARWTAAALAAVVAAQLWIAGAQQDAQAWASDQTLATLSDESSQTNPAGVPTAEPTPGTVTESQGQQQATSQSVAEASTPASPQTAAPAQQQSTPAATGQDAAASPPTSITLPEAQPVAPDAAQHSLTAITRIDVALSGYQAEVDRCVWVRMDIGAVAPIVGAHRGCGGEVALDLRDGDRVQLAGMGLDGDYVVAGSRDAHSGDVASVATAGMVADVLLQTCYEGRGDAVRLVALVRA